MSELQKSDAMLKATDLLPRVDVCVVGGGVAGLCCALAAAREGASTVLVHNRPVLGGNSSTEIRVPPFGAGHFNPSANETGIVLELLTEERAHGHDRTGYGMANAPWDQVLFDAVRREKNLQLLLNTQVLHVAMEEDRVASIIGAQLGTEKVIQVEAHVFIDCSGDGVVGIGAGIPFRMGLEARSKYGESLAAPDGDDLDWTQGSSLFFRARDIGRPVEFIPPSWAIPYEENDLSHRVRSHRHIDGGYFWIEIGFPYDTIRDNEEIRDELQRHLYGIWDHIKNRCIWKKDAENYVLDWVGSFPGKRESRRFIGAYVMTQSEVQRRELFPDRIAYGGWIIDDHLKGGILRSKEQGVSACDNAPSETPYLVAPFSIPLSVTYSKKVANLFFGGRLMSVSRVVFGSVRVQRTLGVVGQAIGTAAAHAVREELSPRDFASEDIGAIQQSLLRQDCYIPGITNLDPADLARNARVVASSSAPLIAEPDERRTLPLSTVLAQLLPLSCWPDRLRVYLRNTSSSQTTVHGSLRRSADIHDLGALKSAAVVFFSAQTPANWDGPVMIDVPPSDAGKGLYWVSLQADPHLEWRQQKSALPGLTAARLYEDGWRFAPASFSDWMPLAADALPASRPFEPENVICGVARPETWPNVWLSDQGFPQWLSLELAAPAVLDTIQIMWGLNFHRSYLQMTPYFRAPECARDYRIDVRGADGQYHEWVTVHGNYQRLRVHGAPQGFRAAVDAVRITVEATNGAARAEVDEVRIYSV